MWYAIVAILILIADQGLKYWVTLNIPLDTGHVTLIPGVLELTNIHNNGAAFSILQHAPHWIFVIFTLVFAAIAVFCLRRNVVHGKVGRWSVVLVLAGAVGNCIDRILSGYVVDMFNFLFVRFAVFNLADIFIVVAGIALCLHVIFYRGDGSEGEPAPKPARKPRKHTDAPVRAHKLHLPARKQQPIAQPAAPKEPAAHPVAPAPAQDDPFAAWDRAPVQAQPVTPAAPKTPKQAPAAPAAPKPVQSAPKAAAPVPKPADAAPADPLLAYLNSTPAAPAEPEAPAKDTDAAPTDGESYSLDDILAEFSDF
ncbi:MAG: signal peptidase II [Oscillospiraceae bacterium]|nr:signal peptidase II [Oscillospiraceae bacterium]